jgi:hypothetical protein
VTTPEGKPPIENPDGSTTLPGGGTVKTPGGTEIDVPGGTTIDKNGTVTVGEGKAKISTSGGWTFNVGEGSIIILDADAPLGYRIVFENPFNDVGEGAWYYDDVAFVYTLGLFAGTSETTFSPNSTTTRGMLVTVLARLSGADLSKYTNGSFDDVDANEYYAASVAWARDMGIVSGTGGNNFAPNTEVSRQDLAVIVARFADFADKQLPETRSSADFLDSADVADYAKDAIEAFFKAGIISGRPGNLFDPKGQATRAEVAAILHRFIDKTENAAAND